MCFGWTAESHMPECMHASNLCAIQAYLSCSQLLCSAGSLESIATAVQQAPLYAKTDRPARSSHRATMQANRSDGPAGKEVKAGGLSTSKIGRLVTAKAS